MLKLQRRNNIKQQIQNKNPKISANDQKKILNFVFKNHSISSMSSISPSTVALVSFIQLLNSFDPWIHKKNKS